MEYFIVKVRLDVLAYGILPCFPNVDLFCPPLSKYLE